MPISRKFIPLLFVVAAINFIVICAARAIPMATVESVATKPSTGDGRILFLTRVENTTEIFSVNPDGSNLQPLTDSSGSNFSPAVSPDGRRIAFTSDRDGNQEIYVMDVDGSNPVNLTQSPNADFNAIWSPDGETIFFQSLRDPSHTGALIYRMNKDGSNQIALAESLPLSLDPAQSPDGSRLAFVGRSGLYLLDASRFLTAKLTRAEDRRPFWTPDGRKVGFISNRYTGIAAQQYIYVVDISSLKVTKLGDIPIDARVRPVWSPDGAHIAFVVSDEANSDIYVMNADGSQAIKLTRDAGVDNLPAWSPDGRHIAFNSNRSGRSQIYVMDADGSNVAQLTTSGENFAPVWTR